MKPKKRLGLIVLTATVFLIVVSVVIVVLVSSVFNRQNQPRVIGKSSDIQAVQGLIDFLFDTTDSIDQLVIKDNSFHAVYYGDASTIYLKIKGAADNITRYIKDHPEYSKFNFTISGVNALSGGDIVIIKDSNDGALLSCIDSMNVAQPDISKLSVFSDLRGITQLVSSANFGSLPLNNELEVLEIQIYDGRTDTSFFAEMNKLRELYIWVRTNNVQYLSECYSLETLSLYFNNHDVNFDFTSLYHLTQIKSLTIKTWPDTISIAEDTKRELENALPHCEITYQSRKN